jgi:hypothetical protein
MSKNMTRFQGIVVRSAIALFNTKDDNTYQSTRKMSGTNIVPYPGMGRMYPYQPYFAGSGHQPISCTITLPSASHTATQSGCQYTNDSHRVFALEIVHPKNSGREPKRGQLAFGIRDRKPTKDRFTEREAHELVVARVVVWADDSVRLVGHRAGRGEAPESVREKGERDGV